MYYTIYSFLIRNFKPLATCNFCRCAVGWSETPDDRFSRHDLLIFKDIFCCSLVHILSSNGECSPPVPSVSWSSLYVCLLAMLPVVSQRNDLPGFCLCTATLW